MARRPRRNHSPTFEAKVAVAAIKGEKTPLISPGEIPAFAFNSGTSARTLDHHSSGSSSAHPGSMEWRSTGLEASASTRSGNAISSPVVDVVPMSRPKMQSIFSAARSRHP